MRISYPLGAIVHAAVQFQSHEIHCHDSLPELRWELLHPPSSSYTGYFASLRKPISGSFPLRCHHYNAPHIFNSCRWGVLNLSVTSSHRLLSDVNVKHLIAQHEHVCPVNLSSGEYISTYISLRLNYCSLPITCVRMPLIFTVAPCT